MRLLRGADFRNLWLGETVSLFGDQVTLIALPLAAVLVLDADAAEMGYLTAAALIPHLLFSLPAGAWLERVERRRWLMIASDVARGGFLASIPIAYALDALTFGAALRGRVPHGDVRGHLRHLPHDALRRRHEARGLRRGELAPERKPRLLVRGRPERRRHPRPDPERARCAARWTRSPSSHRRSSSAGSGPRSLRSSPPRAACGPR